MREPLQCRAFGLCNEHNREKEYEPIVQGLRLDPNDGAERFFSGQYMSYKILFAGIDGSGKSTLADLLTSKLSKKYRILKIGNRNSYILHNCEKKEVVTYKWYELIDHKIHYKF